MLEYLAQPPDFHDPHIVAIYDELSLWSARFGMLLLDHLRLEPLEAILDVGCGTGFPLFEIAQMYGDACQVTGIDVWDEGLERARVKQRLYDLKHVQLLHADAAALPFPSASFDLIVSNLGLNNFDQPARALAECARVAKPHARIMLTTNVMGHMREFYQIYREVLIAQGATDAIAALAKHEVHRGTKETVCALVQDAGFAISDVVEDEFYLRFRDGSSLLRHFFIRLGFLSGWRSIVDPADEDTIFAQLEERLNAKARVDGEVRLTIPMVLVEGQRVAAT